MTFVVKLIDTLKKPLAFTLFFYLCFIFFLGLKKAFLAEYDITLYIHGKALAAALIMGKVVVLTDHLKPIKKGYIKPGVLEVIVRSFIYLFAYLIFSVLEILFKHFFFGKSLAEEASKLVSPKFAVELTVYFVIFMVMNTFLYIQEHIGSDTMHDLFLSRKPSAPKNPTFIAETKEKH